jgi:ABC-2 type transport system ATP-binding protein
MARGQVWLAERRPVGAGVTWRNADGRYRSIGNPPPGSQLVAPTVEDGYLLLVGDAALSEAM